MTSSARLANITGALLLTQWKESADHRPDLARAANSLNALFEETLLVGGEPALDWPGVRVDDPQGAAGELYSLLAAWEAASSERVLVVKSEAAGRCPDLLLALTAWPESDAVIVSEPEGGSVLCSVFRREECAGVAREALEAGDLTFPAFLAALASAGTTQDVSIDRLGLGDLRDDLRDDLRNDLRGGVQDA